MFGVNYRYEINPEKSTIKLAPTRGGVVTIFVLTVLSVVVPILAAEASDQLDADDDLTKDTRPRT